jgi:glycosyltransferase involved in cell wall biosynthesis
MTTYTQALISKPLVSIIIPSYNRENTISFAVNSIINQQCNFDFEIIIGDDCSTDNVRNLLIDYQRTYPEKITLLFQEENLGLGANWAICVQHARGKYLANCDNDDYWHNTQKLQLQVDFMEAHPEYGVLHTDYRNHNRKTGQMEEIIASDIVYGEPLQNVIFSGRFRCCNATVMYQKRLIDKYLPLDDYIKNRFPLQDWNTWIILAAHTKFYCLPNSTATVGIETESITRPNDYNKVEQRFEKERVCYQYLCNLFPQNLSFDEKGYNHYVLSILLNLAYKKSDYKIAKKYAHQLKEHGSNSFKVKMTKNWCLFKIFVLAKIVRKTL